MFDILVVFAVIYFIGSALMKRVAAAQRKAGAPPRVPGRAPSAGPIPPASSAGAPRDSGSRRSTFETLYEAIRDHMDPSAQEGNALPSAQDQAPKASPPYPARPWGSLEGTGLPRNTPEDAGHPRASFESEGIVEGASEPQRYPNPHAAGTGSASPVQLTGLGIQLNANTLVNGVIISEILNRKGRGMRR